ncbi:MAG: hypothetical protein FIB08_17340 [Candidatus Methanoperedens sp.]|nr:hypothetical protein [Candidatus Methanoperedens sp.]
MLETPQERVRLLKAGINKTTIEKLYLIYNNFRIIQAPVLFRPDEIHCTVPQPGQFKGEPVKRK